MIKGRTHHSVSQFTPWVCGLKTKVFAIDKVGYASLTKRCNVYEDPFKAAHESQLKKGSCDLDLK